MFRLRTAKVDAVSLAQWYAFMSPSLLILGAYQLG